MAIVDPQTAWFAVITIWLLYGEGAVDQFGSQLMIVGGTPQSQVLTEPAFGGPK